MITNNLYVIAAICGNFWQESTVNPGIWEGLTVNAPGFGLGQWTDNPPVVERRTALFNWLDANGYSRDSGLGQLRFLMYENVWVPNGAGYASDYNTLTEFLHSTSTNLSDLTYEFFHHWEGIHDASGPNRLDAAQRFLFLFENDPGTREAWHSGNYYNDWIDAQKNALLIMDFFLGDTPPEPPEPPEPPTPTPPTEEELIAMLKVALKRKNKGGIIIVF